tara:strand:- start:226 stop:738 length:513 start_codon:yes stop_codon:yes gene_type:complete
MNRFWLVILMSTLLAGCVLYPTTRDYYKPIAKQGQLPAASASCGYHKAKHDGLEQGYANHKISVYPTRDAENAISVVTVLESSSEQSEINDTQVITESGAIMAGESKTRLTSKYLDSEGIYRSWYEVTYPPLKVTPEHLTILISDESGKTLEFVFERTTQDDIYYSSINC